MPVAKITTLDTLPLILTLTEMAAIYRVAESTIRRGLQNGTFAPRPIQKYPYRWKRADVTAHLARPPAELPRRAHGFAAKLRPARMKLPSPTKRASK